MKKIILFFFIAFLMLFCGCSKEEHVYKVTVVEIMSSSCEACMKMRPVMAKLAAKYRNSRDVKVIIYDTDTDEGAEKAELLHVKKLPTLIFMDSTGMEYFRSETSPPFEIIEALIKAKNVE